MFRFIWSWAAFLMVYIRFARKSKSASAHTGRELSGVVNPRVGKRPRQLAGGKPAGDHPERKGEASPRRSALVLSWPMRPIWRTPHALERADW